MLDKFEYCIRRNKLRLGAPAGKRSTTVTPLVDDILSGLVTRARWWFETWAGQILENSGARAVGCLGMSGTRRE